LVPLSSSVNLDETRLFKFPGGLDIPEPKV
jgi:hypothetical protein